MADYINPSSLSPEVRAFVSRVRDMIKLADARNVRKFSTFLDGRQQMLARQTALSERCQNFLMYCGLDDEDN